MVKFLFRLIEKSLKTVEHRIMKHWIVLFIELTYLGIQKMYIPPAFLVVCFLIFFPKETDAQTGPGGVGNAATNKVWLDASYMTGLSNGASVSQWNDRSGNNWHAHQTNATNYPTFLVNQLNGQPTIHFNRTAAPQYLEITNPGIGFAMSNSNTIFAVSRASTGGSSNSGGGLYQIIFSTGDGYITGLQYSGYPSLVSTIAVQWVGGIGDSPTANINVTTPTSQNVWTISNQWNKEIVSGTTLKSYINGLLKGTRTSNYQMADYSAIDNVRIGAYAPAVYTAALNGDIAEVIFYNVVLNDAQRIIVDNYLSAKYNLAITGDYYTGNDPAFTLDVQGIGTTDGTTSNKHSQAGNGKGLLLSEYNNTLNSANEYLICGHNSLVNSLVIADLPAGEEIRWKRIWYLKKTGQIDANISFDFSEAGLVPDAGLANSLNGYHLLYRSGSSGNFSVVTGDGVALTPSLNNADQLTFMVANTVLNDGYYTLGYSGGIVWTGSVNTEWDNAGNWNIGRVPEAADQVSVYSCSVCPEISNDVNISSLQLNNGSKLKINNRVLTVSGPAHLEGTSIESSNGSLDALDFNEVKNSLLRGPITLKKIGGNNNTWYGGNTFSAEVKLINSSSSSLEIASQADNIILEM